MSGLNLPISLEFFPPKTPEGVEKLRLVRQHLYALKPEFCSVTYGAGGSTQEGTFNTVRDILAEGVAAASHFSCIGATKASVREELATLKAMGVKRLVALRGDLPSGYGAGGEFLEGEERGGVGARGREERFVADGGDFVALDIFGLGDALLGTVDLTGDVLSLDLSSFGSITRLFFDDSSTGAGFAYSDFSFDQTAAVPLPASLPLLAAGMGLLAVARRRSRKS
mgnify:CR=1 FL=1